MTDSAISTGLAEDTPAVTEDAVHGDAVRLVREFVHAMECRILSQAGRGTTSLDSSSTPLPNPLMDQLVHLARVAALGTLAGSIAHEIRQPLTSIRVETYAMQRWMNRAEPNLPEVTEGIRRIQDSSERVEQLIRSLRSLMRRERPSYHALQLDQAVLEIVPLVEARLYDANIRFKLHLDAAVPPLYGDRVQIQQIVLNLLINAIDALEAGPHGGCAKIDLHIGLAAGGMASIEVIDNGSGIEPDKIAQIFDLFFSTKRDGMGVGLAICRMIAEAHGGSIRATSERGKTTFTVTLPTASRKNIAS